MRARVRRIEEGVISRRTNEVHDKGLTSYICCVVLLYLFRLLFGTQISNSVLNMKLNLT
jgi:hypothetical protein